MIIFHAQSRFLFGKEQILGGRDGKHSHCIIKTGRKVFSAAKNAIVASPTTKTKSERVKV